MIPSKSSRQNQSFNPEDEMIFHGKRSLNQLPEKFHPSSRESTLFVKEDSAGIRIKGRLGDKTYYYQMRKGQVKLDKVGNYVTQMKGYLDVSRVVRLEPTSVFLWLLILEV